MSKGLNLLGIAMFVAVATLCFYCTRHARRKLTRKLVRGFGAVNVLLAMQLLAITMRM